MMVSEKVREKRYFLFPLSDLDGMMLVQTKEKKARRWKFWQLNQVVVDEVLCKEIVDIVAEQRESNLKRNYSMQ